MSQGFYLFPLFLQIFLISYCEIPKLANIFAVFLFTLTQRQGVY